MLAFPQFGDKAVIQYPYRWRQKFRTRLADNDWGSLPRQTDGGFEERRFSCVLRGLSDGERVSIQNLFVATAGGYRAFTFLSPHENLLADSEALATGSWIKDPGLVLVSGFADPLGGLGATRVSNPAGMARRFRQVIEAPSEYRYCASFWGRSASSSNITFQGGAATAPSERVLRFDGTWRRFVVTVQSSEVVGQTAFGLVLPAVTEVEVFGWQVEASGAATEYKKTVGPGGVIANCRFADDRLEWTSEFPGQHTVRINLAAT
ncbi:MAG: hypothetical protein JNK87_20160 [Bryobacterales bacterium]|nr:hypothetical protein [Bryobacterales bacterium]